MSAQPEAFDTDPRMPWVTLKKYCELTGETSKSVKWKRLGGRSKDTIHLPAWTDGIEYQYDPKGQLWINLEAVQSWITQSAPPPAR